MELSSLPDNLDGIVCRPEEDGAFLLNPDTGNVSYINRTALEVYYLIDGRKDVASILAVFGRRYPEIAAKRQQTDIAAVLDDFVENQFITTHSEHCR